MELPLKIEGFQGRDLTLRTATFFCGPKLFVDGQEVRGKRRHYTLRDNQGKNLQCVMRFNGFDPVPKIAMAGRPISLVRQPRWYEYAWISLPIILALGGGVLGVLCGVPAIYCSARIFRGARGTLRKFVITGAVSAVSALTFVVTASLISLLIDAL